ncbi:PREDICTED: beta-defensin 134 [Hipposideros armiger]|uniref:Beta-defensin n=1 Tax=Hipposideros armiger TaxID=186990 RepID=A0A8B7QSN1_HIPAR|nr:PREDICTED: beta-defensin 134 [Hipposideros armiger]
MQKENEANAKRNSPATLGNGLNPISTEMYKSCYKIGTCRLECHASEKLVDYCMFHLECCVKGNPA